MDSLDAGGGERMAVHLANILSTKLTTSALVCTRHTGILEKDLNKQVKFKCLYKKRALDFKALIRLSKFIKAHKINIIHAHSTSFFIATLLKIKYPKIKIVWHDHYGFSDNLEERPIAVLKLSSIFFNHIISVNEKLKSWALQHLLCKNVTYIQNFSLKNNNSQSISKLRLKGNAKAIKIIHIANLRPQKDHLTALKAIKRVLDKSYIVSYHLVGGYDLNSEYYKDIINFIQDNNLEDNVFIYGSQSEISNLLKQADIAILSSISEGLPVSLIEYGQAQLPVIVTDVGQCKDVVGNHAKIIDAKDDEGLSDAIKYYIENPKEATSYAIKLRKKISKEYDPEFIINKVINIYTKALKKD
ncbi:glycosyltransferase family 4 protein [Psychroflexus sp. MBR-150]